MTDDNLLNNPTSYYIKQIKDSDGLWSHWPDMAYDTILDASRSAHDYIGGCLQTADQSMQRADHYSASDLYENRPDNIISYTVADHAGIPVFHNFIQHAIADDTAIQDKTGYQAPFRIDCIWDAIGIWAHQPEADYETFREALIAVNDYIFNCLKASVQYEGQPWVNVGYQITDDHDKIAFAEIKTIEMYE